MAYGNSVSRSDGVHVRRWWPVPRGLVGGTSGEATPWPGSGHRNWRGNTPGALAHCLLCGSDVCRCCPTKSLRGAGLVVGKGLPADIVGDKLASKEGEECH